MESRNKDRISALEDEVRRLKADVFKLGAIAFCHRRSLTTLEYVRNASGFLYSDVASDNLATRTGLSTGSFRNHPPSLLLVPTVEMIYQHVLTNHLLTYEG